MATYRQYDVVAPGKDHQLAMETRLMQGRIIGGQLQMCVTLENAAGVFGVLMLSERDMLLLAEQYTKLLKLASRYSPPAPTPK